MLTMMTTDRQEKKSIACFNEPALPQKGLQRQSNAPVVLLQEVSQMILSPLANI